ncbi:MAG: hypothetical protein GF317_23405 [Candidatus Lokiarchaeota archaeon]|nr:hypothetical protein [Candidatus Lokiarchaeota archaeon]
MAKIFGNRIKYVLTIDSTDYDLDITPDNNLGIEFTRSEKYFGVIRSLTNDLQFKFDQGDLIGGADLLKTEFEANGIFGVAELTIKTRDTQNPLQYNDFYTGLIDFKSYIENKDYVQVKSIENSDVQKLFSRDEVIVNLLKTTSLDGISMTNFDMYKSTKVIGETISYAGLIEGLENINGPVTMAANEDSSVYYGIVGTIIYNDGGRLSIPTVSDQKLYINDFDTESFDVNVKFTIDLGITVTYSGSGTFGVWNLYSKVKVYNDTDVLQTWYDVLTITGGNVDVSITPSENDSNSASFDQDINLQPGWYIEVETYIEWFNFTNLNSSAEAFITKNYNNIETLESTIIIDDFTTNFIPIWECFLRNLQLITSNDDPLESEVIGRTDSPIQSYSADGDFSLMLVSNGFKIRGNDKKNVSISFFDLFKTLDAVYNVALWYNRSNQQFEILQKSEVFDNSIVILELGEVSNREISVYEGQYYNEVASGHNKKLDYEEFNGLEEYNTKTNFGTVIDSIKKELNILATCRSDGFGIILAKNAGATSKDNNKFDNDNFILDCKRGSSTDFESITNDDFTLVANVFETSKKKNLNYSPKRCFLRNSNRVSPSYANKTSEDIKFLESQFNSDLQTQKTGEASSITENQDIDYSELDTPLYNLKLHKFSFPVTAAMINVLESNPHGLIRYTYRGEYNYIFLNRLTCDYPDKTGEWEGIEYGS